MRQDLGDTVRVGSTRVTLDQVIGAFRAGATVEEIAQTWDTLRAPDVSAVIGYYLRHRGEVDAYLAEREHESEKLRHRVEARFPPEGVKERLLSRGTARPTS